MLAQNYLKTKMLDQIKGGKNEIDGMIKQYDLLLNAIASLSKVPGMQSYVNEISSSLKEMKRHIKGLVYNTKEMIVIYKDFIDVL